MRHARMDYQEAIVDLRDGPGAIPEAEPVLLLRGQDVFAWRAALAYADLVKSESPGPEGRRVSDTVRRLALEMKAWSAERGKRPDIPGDCRTAYDPPEDPGPPAVGEGSGQAEG